MYEDDNEDYSAPVGTAFAPLEADEIVSRKPEIDQTVRDERGRRRFHGAFTGGFSAGYWNTVGSAEGFTPQIFSSSRVNKADRHGTKGARPEDFMDDEDFGSFGIAPKRIHTKEDFAENSSFAGLRDTSLTFDDVIKSVFAPSKQSIGMRLFQKMKRHVKMEQKARQRDLFLLQKDDRQSNSSKSTAKETLQYETKGDLHGLGYNGALDPENFLYGDPMKALIKPDAVSATLGGGRRIKISGEAFGYGALEEEDDYMMGGSVYGTDDMSQYDFALGGPASREKDRRKKRTSPYGTLSGNSLELEGFEKAAQRFSLFAEMRRHYRPPEVPSNWRPKKRKRRKGVEELKKSRWGPKFGEETKPTPLTETIESVGDSGKTQQATLNANLRAVILGEEIVHRMGIAKPPPPSLPPPPQPSKPGEDKKQPLHSTSSLPVPQKPLSGFFASRFTRGSSALEDPSISAGLSTFKDLTSTPGFESGSQRRGDEEAIEDESTKPPTRSTFQWHPHKLLCRRFGLQHPYPQFPDVVGIVSVDRSGQKTRNMTSTLQNVKQASQSSSSCSRTLFAGLFGNLDGLAHFSPAVTADSAEALGKSLPMPPPPSLPAPNSLQSTTVIEESDEEDKEENEAEKIPRPPIDLFKSIFASDEEDDSDDEEVKENSAKKASDSAENATATAAKDSSTAETSEVASNGVERRRLGGGGSLFAGVDFVQLNQNFNPCLKPQQQPQNIEPSLTSADVISELDEDCYGPALPPPPSTSTLTSTSLPAVNNHLNIHSSTGKSSSSSSSLKTSQKSEKASDSHHKGDSSKSSTHRSGDRYKESSQSRRHKESSNKSKKSKKKSKKKSSSSLSKSSSSKHYKSSGSKRKNSSSSSSSDDDSFDHDRNSSPEVKRHKQHSIDNQILELIKQKRRQKQHN